MKGYMVGPGEGLEDDPELKGSRRSTGGALTFIETEATGGAPPHLHAREDECYYVLEGAITVHCGDEVFDCPAGSFVFLPRGIPHSWDVTGDAGMARVLLVAVPGGLEEFLSEFHSVEGDARWAVAARYGIEFLR